ncbi:MAG: hypothetical protein ACKVPY_02795 [Paracoccaceae bacterium]
MLTILADSLLLATRIGPLRTGRRPTAAEIRRAEQPKRTWVQFVMGL